MCYFCLMQDIWQYIDLWEFLAGLGIFMFGMHYMETSIKDLAGATFKRFLRNQTNTPIKAILSGTVATAVLQSSSVVTLMVLAFVGAGVIQLQNALGIIVGANLGTTFTGWIVATLGFKLNIESFALPLIAIGGISLAFFSGREKVRNVGSLLIGFGFLFLGLNYMKEAIDTLAQNVDLSVFAEQGIVVFFVVGFILTAIIQSSSATMVITLSALSAGIIPLESAIAMVIGGDLGTTITALLGSIGGTPAKKRAGLSHFLFNLITAVLGLALLYPLVYLLRNVLGITDPLYSLVSFHSLFNLLGIIVVFPFLGMFARALERMFKDDERYVASFIPKVTIEVPDAAIAALEKEIYGLLDRVVLYNTQVFDINTDKLGIKQPHDRKSLFKNGNNSNDYLAIKQLEGEMVAYYLSIQNQKLEGDEPESLEKFVFAIRSAMQAAKAVKDISHNVVDIQRSASELQMAFLDKLRAELSVFYKDLFEVLYTEHQVGQMELLADLNKRDGEVYQKFLNEIYDLARTNRLNQVDLSTLLNLNREVYHSNSTLIFAVKDLVLPVDEARSFSRLQEFV